MAKAYTKEDLVGAFLMRFVTCPLITVEQVERLEAMAEEFYDKVGRDKFREYASVTPEIMREYFAWV